MFKKSLFICMLLSISGLQLEAPSCLPNSELSKMLQFAGAGLFTGGLRVFFSNDKPKDQAPPTQATPAEDSENNDEEDETSENSQLADEENRLCQTKANNRRLGVKIMAAGTLAFLASQAILPNKNFKEGWTAITYLARNATWSYFEKLSPFTSAIVNVTGAAAQLGITT